MSHPLIGLQDPKLGFLRFSQTKLTMKYKKRNIWIKFARNTHIVFRFQSMEQLCTFNPRRASHGLLSRCLQITKHVWWLLNESSNRLRYTQALQIFSRELLGRHGSAQPFKWPK